MSLTLRWKQVFPRQGLALIGWSRKRTGEIFPLHDHDYPEVFWIEEGELGHTINGETTVLRRGELRFVRANDRHEFIGRGDPGGVVANVAVRASVISDLRRRYGSAATEAWWHGQPVPPRITLSVADVHTLGQAARELAARAHVDRLAVDRFLLNLIELIRRPDAARRATGEPGWLSDARAALGDPRHLAGGVARLNQLAGCSAEHLARTVKRVHGVTPTDLVNQQRLEWAASELMFSGREIADVALAAGFESLSHFYHLFRRQHGTTPRRFRLRGRSLT